MRIRATFIVIAMFASVLAATAVSADPALEERTERLFIAAGCPQDTPGTCTSTRWLGKTPGDSSSNFITSITPVDEALYQATGELNWRDYAGDSTTRQDGYRLIGDSTIDVSMTLTAQGAGLNTTVHARLNGVIGGGFNTTTFTAPPQSIVAFAGTQVVDFSFPVPADLDGKVLKNLTFETAVRGVNAAAGYIDQQGGSTVKIPHMVEAS